MGRKNTIWGHYDEDLEKELKRHKEQLRKLGVKKPTKLESSALIAEKARKYRLEEWEIKKIVKKKRGLL